MTVVIPPEIASDFFIIDFETFFLIFLFMVVFLMDIFFLDNVEYSGHLQELLDGVLGDVDHALVDLITLAKQEMTGKTLAASGISSGLSDLDVDKKDSLTIDFNTSSIVLTSESWICFIFHQF